MTQEQRPKASTQYAARTRTNLEVVPLDQLRQESLPTRAGHVHVRGVLPRADAVPYRVGAQHFEPASLGRTVVRGKQKTRGETVSAMWKNGMHYRTGEHIVRSEVQKPRITNGKQKVKRNGAFQERRTSSEEV